MCSIERGKGLLPDGAGRRSCRRLIRVSIVSNERSLLDLRWPASPSPGVSSRCFAPQRGLGSKPNLEPRPSRRRFRNSSREHLNISPSVSLSLSLSLCRCFYSYELEKRSATALERGISLHFVTFQTSSNLNPI